MFNAGLQVGCPECEVGLGYTIKMAPRWSEAQFQAKVRERQTYWLKQMADDLADQYRAAGYKINY